jgi:hypothetical protein
MKIRYLWMGVWYVCDMYADNTGDFFDYFEQRTKTSHLQRWTGLRAYNGALIWEGDILLLQTAQGMKEHSVEWVNFANYTGWRLYGEDRRWNVPLTMNRVFNGRGVVVSNLAQRK